MARYIKTRSSEQCHSHYQKYYIFDNIIEFITQRSMNLITDLRILGDKY
jgi:hypothetical protein